MNSTNTKFMEQLTTLPSLKNVDLANLKPNAVDWRKGEKPTFNIISLLLIAGIGYAFWVFVLPIIFGMVLDGTKEASKRLESMLFWDVNNGISRRSWARNEGAIFAIKRAMATQPLLKITIPTIVDDGLLDY